MNERQEPGFARWSMLSDFAPSAEPKQPMQRQCVGKLQKEAAEGPLVCTASPDSEALSELFSSD